MTSVPDGTAHTYKIAFNVSGWVISHLIVAFGTSSKMICCPVQSEASVLASYLACHLGTHLAWFYQIAKAFRCGVRVWEVTYGFIYIYLSLYFTYRHVAEDLLRIKHCFFMVTETGVFQDKTSWKFELSPQSETSWIHIKWKRFFSFFKNFSLSKNIFNDNIVYWIGFSLSGPHRHDRSCCVAGRKHLS